MPKVMNARHLSGGKRSKESIDVQQTTESREIYRPPPGSMSECYSDVIFQNNCPEKSTIHNVHVGNQESTVHMAY